MRHACRFHAYRQPAVLISANRIIYASRIASCVFFFAFAVTCFLLSYRNTENDKKNRPFGRCRKKKRHCVSLSFSFRLLLLNYFTTAESTAALSTTVLSTAALSATTSSTTASSTVASSAAGFVQAANDIANATAKNKTNFFISFNFTI